ncbi:serine/threonine-protein kinase [Sesbania bispinosa]|nr:serine/threonine-protein kinase [Sesbania bispinosa]
MVKKLQREKKLDTIVDSNLNKNYNIEEVEMIVQVALLCTQASPEDRPVMSLGDKTMRDYKGDWSLEKIRFKLSHLLFL